jgi:hypothetical protein
MIASDLAFGMRSLSLAALPARSSVQCHHLHESLQLRRAPSALGRLTDQPQLGLQVRISPPGLDGGRRAACARGHSVPPRRHGPRQRAALPGCPAGTDHEADATAPDWKVLQPSLKKLEVRAFHGDRLSVEEPCDGVDELHQAAGAVRGRRALPAGCFPLAKGMAGAETQQHPPGREYVQGGGIRRHMQDLCIRTCST